MQAVALLFACYRAHLVIPEIISDSPSMDFPGPHEAKMPKLLRVDSKVAWVAALLSRSCPIPPTKGWSRCGPSSQLLLTHNGYGMVHWQVWYPVVQCKHGWWPFLPLAIQPESIGTDRARGEPSCVIEMVQMHENPRVWYRDCSHMWNNWESTASTSLVPRFYHRCWSS